MLPEIHRQSGGSFANHDEFLKYSASAQFVIREVFALDSLDEVLGSVGRFYYVGQVEFLTPRSRLAI
jgi:hypothetical protein